MTQDHSINLPTTETIAYRFHRSPTGTAPYYLTVHPTQHGQALMAAVQAAHHGMQMHIQHNDHQALGQWHISCDPLPSSRPAPSYDPDDE